ncbi:cation-translocating P-type ATPase [Methylobacterium adhaesivum]|uniref:Cation-transporting P-type ATPase n=1 Tax=Methylobacterium adhaesivum TaxID=333297 RepID=A0ABT8BIE9_9HYPH|nr:cation-transporting P-type ATPase [Methylobacterium adhaesivum]MDN3591081.1 cation-transporting P-type ATPase [Methylobacterium adhaesivum]
MAQIHAAPVADVPGAFGTCLRSGLSDAEARRRLARYGPNVIAAKEKTRPRALLVHQLASPVVYLLAAAGVLSFAFGDWQEGMAIIAVLAINSGLGFFTELRAARSIEGLRALGGRSARARRDGRTRGLAAEELVPGDIVLLEGGDAVPADIRLVEASNLGADESLLTGESVPVDKTADPVGADTPVTERASMLLRGTLITRGSGTGVVVATGSETELGAVSRLVAQAEPDRSPLERRLERLSGQMVWVILTLALALVGVGVATGKDLRLMIEAGIALAVAAIPEGLPIVATLTLARGMWRMARKNALIERLSAVETLGATTVILTDKTGTLTENRMTVRRLSLPLGEVDLTDPSSGAAGGSERLFQVAVLCNDATLGEGPVGDSGDPMEQALLRAGLSVGLKRTALVRERPLVRKHAFDAARRMMATVHASGSDHLTVVKGAPEAVLAASRHVDDGTGAVPLDDAARCLWRRRAEELASRGLRVIACAEKTTEDATADPFGGLVFLGLIGLEDPAREGVPDALAACRRAGIRVIMVTGDHAYTALSVAHAVGLARPGDRVMEGGLLGDGRDRLDEVAVFARVSPADKLALVKAYQQGGEIVAMTGDGVNDAPALKQADIGVAMGRRGTDVAREAAAMVLLDDAFPTIVGAVREGRVIFDNIRRFAAYLLACNLSEIMVVGLAILSALPLPILPLQILYLNVVTDVFPAFALAMCEGRDDLLARPPRAPKEAILERAQWVRIVAHGALMTGATFASLAAADAWLALDRAAVVTVTFLTLAFAQLWHVFNMRASASGPLRNEVTRNPWIWAALLICTGLLVGPAYAPRVGTVLGLVPPDSSMWAIVLCASLLPVLVIQIGTMALAGRR